MKSCFRDCMTSDVLLSIHFARKMMKSKADLIGISQRGVIVGFLYFVLGCVKGGEKKKSAHSSELKW